MRGGLGALGKLGWLDLERPKRLKIKLWRDLGAGLGEFCKALGSLDVSLTRLVCALGPYWSVGGRLGGVLEAAWRRLGVSWGHLVFDFHIKKQVV